MALSALGREVEQEARDNRLEGVAEQLAQSEAEFVRARAVLEAMRDEL